MTTNNTREDFHSHEHRNVTSDSAGQLYSTFRSTVFWHLSAHCFSCMACNFNVLLQCSYSDQPTYSLHTLPAHIYINIRTHIICLSVQQHVELMFCLSKSARAGAWLQSLFYHTLCFACVEWWHKTALWHIACLSLRFLLFNLVNIITSVTSREFYY